MRNCNYYSSSFPRHVTGKQAGRWPRRGGNSILFCNFVEINFWFYLMVGCVHDVVQQLVWQHDTSRVFYPTVWSPYLICNKYYFYIHENVRLLAILVLSTSWFSNTAIFDDIVVFFMLHSNARWYIIVSQIQGNSLSTRLHHCQSHVWFCMVGNTVCLFQTNLTSDLNFIQILLV